MYPSCPITQQQIEAFIDGDLSPQDLEHFYIHLNNCICCHRIYNQIQQQNELIRTHLSQQTSAALAKVNWQEFSLHIFKQLPFNAHQHCPNVAYPTESSHVQQPSPQVEQGHDTVPVSSPDPVSAIRSSTYIDILNTLRWLWQRPNYTIAAVAFCCIIMIFAVPLSNQDSNNNEDFVVDQIISKDTAQVAILQTENQFTGRTMSVIVVNEPQLNNGNQVPTDSAVPLSDDPDHSPSQRDEK